jgi:hypothetical protein
VVVILYQLDNHHCENYFEIVVATKSSMSYLTQQLIMKDRAKQKTSAATPASPVKKRRRLSIDLDANPEILSIIQNAKRSIKKSTGMKVEDVEIARQAFHLLGKKRGYLTPKPD